VKGAPITMVEVISQKYKELIPQWLELNRQWAADGLRVLFFAYKIFDQKPGEIKESTESDLDFLGMTAMIDPPREEVIEAISQCKTAGIRNKNSDDNGGSTAYRYCDCRTIRNNCRGF
jgi:Ca2+-transporting ATPase